MQVAIELARLGRLGCEDGLLDSQFQTNGETVATLDSCIPQKNLSFSTTAEKQGMVSQRLLNNKRQNAWGRTQRQDAQRRIYLASNFSKTCSSGETAAIPFNPKCLQLMLRVGKCYPLSQRSRGDAPFRNDGIQPISSWAFLQCICQVRSSFRAASPSSSLFHFALGKILNPQHAVFAPNL